MMEVGRRDWEWKGSTRSLRMERIGAWEQGGLRWKLGMERVGG